MIEKVSLYIYDDPMPMENFESPPSVLGRTADAVALPSFQLARSDVANKLAESTEAARASDIARFS